MVGGHGCMKPAVKPEDEKPPEQTGFHDVDEYYPPDECNTHVWTCPKCFKTLIGVSRENLEWLFDYCEDEYEETHDKAYEKEGLLRDRYLGGEKE